MISKEGGGGVRLKSPVHKGRRLDVPLSLLDIRRALMRALDGNPGRGSLSFGDWGRRSNCNGQSPAKFSSFLTHIHLPAKSWWVLFLLGLYV